jgi:hypothetical protein
LEVSICIVADRVPQEGLRGIGNDITAPSDDPFGVAHGDFLWNPRPDWNFRLTNTGHGAHACQAASGLLAAGFSSF